MGRDAALIAAFTNLYTSADQATLASFAAGTNGYTDVMRSYDESLAAAFGAVLRDTKPASDVAAHARAIVFDRVIVPYDALFGQIKNDHASDELFDAAHGAFARWLIDSSGVAAAARPAALGVFDGWMHGIADLTHSLLARWHDSRLVWLPAQLALSLDQFDDQAEVDGIVGRVVGHAFTNDNELAYLRTADLPLEIARSIMAARRYHVLWTHDFTGRRPSKAARRDLVHDRHRRVSAGAHGSRAAVRQHGRHSAVHGPPRRLLLPRPVRTDVDERSRKPADRGDSASSATRRASPNICGSALRRSAPPSPTRRGCSARRPNTAAMHGSIAS